MISVFFYTILFCDSTAKKVPAPHKEDDILTPFFDSDCVWLIWIIVNSFTDLILLFKRNIKFQKQLKMWASEIVTCMRECVIDDDARKWESRERERANKLVTMTKLTSLCFKWSFFLSGSKYLSTLASDASGQLNVLRHDGDTLGVDRAQVGVLEQADQVGLGSFLQEREDNKSPVRWVGVS